MLPVESHKCSVSLWSVNTRLDMNDMGVRIVQSLFLKCTPKSPPQCPECWVSWCPQCSPSWFLFRAVSASRGWAWMRCLEHSETGPSSEQQTCNRCVITFWMESIKSTWKSIIYMEKHTTLLTRLAKFFITIIQQRSLPKSLPISSGHNLYKCQFIIV